MKNNKLSAPVSYLPLQKFHIVPITALDPLSIKASAKKAKCDREKIKYNTLLNATVKALGIKGGFSEYQRIYNSELIPFMKKHGMKKRVDLLKARKKGGDTYLTDITHQDLSERLFFSGLELPEKIFTGYNFDYNHTINDGVYYFNSSLCINQKSKVFSTAEIEAISGEGNTHFPLEIIESVGPYDLRNMENDGRSYALLKKIAKHNIKIAHAYPNIVLECPYDKKPLKSFLDLGKKDYEPDSAAMQAGIDRYNCFANRTLLDVVVGSFGKDLGLAFNLLGDSLVLPSISTRVVKLYLGNIDRESLNQEKEYVDAGFNLFRERIELGEDGWVEIIPFSNNLIFLKGRNGEYDFVFKNQRDKIFEHQIFGKSLKRADIPSCISDYQFFRWHYFEYQGWRDMDSHNSENIFYEKGNKLPGSYPGKDTILQSYHEAKGNFIASKMQSSSKLPGFKEVIVSNQPLMISNLITIDELCLFKEANSDYLDYRGGDKLDSVNVELDSSLPATVTWFDVLAYINWFEKETNVPLRLLSLAEYQELRSTEGIPKERIPVVSDLEFVDHFGNVFPKHPPYMAPDDFQELTCRFGNAEKYQSNTGLEFLKSNSFAEWLQEGACIRSGNLKSFYNDDFHIRSTAPSDSTGKYKGVKIGFRLCYDLSIH